MQSIRKKRKMHTALFLVAISSQKKQVIFVFTVFLKRVRKYSQRLTAMFSALL